MHDLSVNVYSGEKSNDHRIAHGRESLFHDFHLFYVHCCLVIGGVDVLFF